MVPRCVTTCYHHCTPRNAHSPGSKSLPVALQLRDVRCGAQKNSENWEIKNQSVEDTAGTPSTTQTWNLATKRFFFVQIYVFFVRDARRFFFPKKKHQLFLCSEGKGPHPKPKATCPCVKPWCHGRCSFRCPCA